MSIVDVSQMWSSIGGSIATPKADATDKTYAFTEAYMVVCTVGTTLLEALAATGVPQNGEQHSSGVAAFVTNSTGTQLSPILFQVTVGFEGESPDPDSVEVEWTDQSTSEPIDRDWSGAAIVTVNGEQVEGLTVEVADQIAIVRKRFLTINTASLRAYRRATNSDTFLGWPPGTCRLVGFSAKNRYKYNQPQEQWSVTARFQFREPYANTTDAQAWYKRWRHEGIYVDDGTGLIRRALDQNGQEVTKPVLLKSDGTQELDPNNAYFVHTQVYGSLPYSGLGLL